MSDPTVRYSASGGIALLEIDAPPANCYSYKLMRDLDEAILKARFDEQVHVLVLTGSGEKFFSAGADIAMLAAVTPTFKYSFCLHANETLLRLEQTAKLVIAALNGHTVGGGLEIALACDLRIARKDAGKLGLPEVNLGVLPGTGGTQRLSRVLGKSRSIELMVSGRLMTMDEANAVGLVERVFDVPAAGFRDQALEYARQFVPPGKASRAVGGIKRAVQSGSELPLAAGLALERELQQLLFESEDAGEGIRAHLEKREAKFTGK